MIEIGKIRIAIKIFDNLWTKHNVVWGFDSQNIIPHNTFIHIIYIL